ncbi:MAG: flagellar filament capping protein FliD [Kofleriaceae bacterium]
MGGITFTGLSSGLDTGALIDQLVATERRSADALVKRQSDLNTHKSIVGSLSTALASLGTVAKGMDLASELQPRTAVSSDTKVSVAASSSAAVAPHELRVVQLARAQVTSSRGFATAGPGTLGAGSVTISASGANKKIEWTSSDSLADIANRINAADAGVSASVVFDGAEHRLVTTAKATGTARAATFSETGDGLGLADPANVRIAARDAIVEIDGISITRGSNVIDDAIAGVTITANAAHAATDPPATVTVDLDRKALTDKLEAFVKAYNSINSALHVQLDYTGTQKGTNTLFGDSTLRQLQGGLANLFSKAYGGASLADIGISRDKTGAMTLDSAKLTKTLAADPRAVEKMFVTGKLATAVTDLTDQYTRAGKGILAAKTQSITDRHKALQTQIDRIGRNADALQSRLEQQFGALEQAMSNLKSQSSYLTSMLVF